MISPPHQTRWPTKLPTMSSSADPTTRPAPSAPAEIRATYTSPQHTNSTPLILTAALSKPLPASTPASVAEKTAYLSSLRGAVVDLQERINVELTARMEEEGSANGNGTVAGKKVKKAGGGKGADQRSNSGKRKLAAFAATIVDEDAEEENYGEEIVEDDD